MSRAIDPREQHRKRDAETVCVVDLSRAPFLASVLIPLTHSPARGTGELVGKGSVSRLTDTGKENRE